MRLAVNKDGLRRSLVFMSVEKGLVFFAVHDVVRQMTESVTRVTGSGSFCDMWTFSKHDLFFPLIQARRPFCKFMNRRLAPDSWRAAGG